ncbi:MAG: AraC family transcriptional regulator ligand-binding domain-containing protein [Cellvibrionaceae bacterium]
MSDSRPQSTPLNDNEPTSLSGWALAVIRTISASGIDPTPLLQEAGIDANTLIDPEARVPVESMSKLWVLAEDATQDETLGLRVPQHIDGSSMFDLQGLIEAAPTIVEGWNLFSRYMPVLSTGLNVRLENYDENHYAMILEPTRPVSTMTQAGDATIAVLTRNLRASSLGISITQIELARVAPKDPAEFERMLGAPVSYGHSKLSVHFSSTNSLTSPQETADPLLEQALESVLKNYLDRMSGDQFAEQVRREIIKVIAGQEPSLERIAERLHMSSRTLQRRLVADGSNYRDVVNEVRQGMALRLVRDTQANFTDIAYQLGFRDASNFSRVFRRWFGATPSDFRPKD